MGSPFRSAIILISMNDFSFMNLEKSLELASDGQLRTLLRHAIPYRPVMFIYGDYCRFKKRHFSIVQLEMRLR